MLQMASKVPIATKSQHITNGIEMGSKWAQNVIHMESKWDQNGIQTESKCSYCNEKLPILGVT